MVTTTERFDCHAGMDDWEASLLTGLVLVRELSVRNESNWPVGCFT